jgi:hypothetical protein
MDPKYAVVQSSGVHNFYWVSIVHTTSHFPVKMEKIDSNMLLKCHHAVSLFL